MTSSRREFLTEVGRVAIVLPAGWAFVSSGCGESYGDDSPQQQVACTGAGRVTVNATAITVSSTCVGDHLHAVRVLLADLSAPPTGGLSVESSTAEAHAHSIALTEAQLGAIEGGSTVSVDSTVANGHSHVFAIKKTPQAGVDPPSGGYGY